METSGTIREIRRLEDAVRDYINTHRYQAELLKNSSTWNQICSSLDSIGDTLYAIDAYVSTEFPKDTGIKYIFSYGLLQALFIQQDALRHLAEAFEFPYVANDALLRIRNIRNASIGHPTKQNHGKTCYHNFISRMTMSKGGFDLLRHFGAKEYESMRVDLLAMITDQLKWIKEGYEQVARRLREADRMHKEKFKEAPICDIFHSAMGYCFEKIGGGIYSASGSDRTFGLLQLRSVKETYEKFENALRERNELNNYTEYDLNEYFHALKRLESYLNGESAGMEESDARIYLSYLRHEHNRFVQIAQEVDDSYLERPKPKPKRQEPIKAIKIELVGVAGDQGQ